MSVPLHSQIRPGTLVSIVLKEDQRTGRQVAGSVSQVLTRHNHPRGVKVRLTDGRIGRVQRLGGPTSPIPATTQALQPQKKYYRKMADHNPWANETQNDQWQGRSQAGNQYSQPQQQQSQGVGNQQRLYDHQQQQPQRPTQDHQYPGSGAQQSYYSEPSYSQQPDYNAWSGESGNPPLPARHPAHTAAPAQGIHRNDTDDLLASQPDRGEQIEHLQAYEASANQSQEDRDRAQLEKQFPDIDGSLIAALYGDTKDLSATRELLQELGRQ